MPVFLHQIPLEVRFKPEDDFWVGICDTLDVASQGKTYEEAQANLNEAIDLFIESCARRGVLAKALQECGLTAHLIRRAEQYAAQFIPPKQPTEEQCRV